ncbi:DUF2076 family protein [Nocardia sp. NPDC051030]|uniref:DUF2076 family protein n=1 Tax=Nocardia sp. NPDC051030 TaxID=3155162 RepID=UPI003441DCB3
MNAHSTEAQRLIESLFHKIDRHAAQSGPQDPTVALLIQQRTARTPGAIYTMAQMLIGQERAIAQLQQQLADARRNNQHTSEHRRENPTGDFLSGAGQIALGVGGGILAAEAIEGVAEGLFGDDDDDSWW